MANKKIFTGYTFEGGGQSKNLRLEAATSDPTNVGKGHAYYNTTAGTIKVSNADADATASWKTLLTTDSSIAASQVDLTNVDAVTLDGKDSSATADADKIPIYGTGGVLPVADPTEDGHAASKGWVDTQVANLVDSSPTTLNTLNELAAALGDDAAFSTSMTTALSNRLRIDVNNQGLSATELTNARTNLGLGALATLSAVGASEITNGEVGTNELADDAITPAKIADTYSFTMNGLTATGQVMLQYNDPVLHIGKVNVTTGNSKLQFNSKNGSAANAFSLQYIKDATNDRLSFLGGGATEDFTVINGGKAGIGVDATAPSGTLHVSTARYGSEEVTDGTFPNFDNWTQTPSSAWSVANNTASCDGTQSGYANLIQTNVFTADKEVRLKVEITVSSGSVTIWANGSQSLISGISSTQNINQVVSPTVTGTIQFECSSNFVGTFKNLSVKEDFLSTQAGDNLSVNAAADDLVIANNDDAGISILSPKTKKGNIYFGDKDGNNRGVISFDHNTDSLIFGLGGDGGGNYSLLIDNSRDAKFAGHIGAGNMAADGVISGKTPEDGFPAIQMFSHDSKAIFQVRDAANSCLVKLYDNDGGTVSQKVELHTNGTSYFNGGDLALGQTTAASRLDVLDTGENVAFFRSSHATAANVYINNKTATVGNKANLYFGPANNIAGVRLFAEAIEDFSFNSKRTADFAIETRKDGTFAEQFRIGSDGTHDHKGNSIVNSATVQGLQDGACYDFDGANTNHIALPTAAYDAVVGDRITVAAWIKRTSDSGEYDGIVSVNGLVNQAEGFALLIDGTDDKLFWQYDGQVDQIDHNDSGGQVLALNVWYHVVGIYDGSNLKTYVNGVLDRTQSGAEKALSGTNKIIVIGNQHTNANKYFRGQIRDVKIFPSALEAADIRKLYAGENPKKNLNVELWANSEDWDGASGGTQPQSWTEANAGNWTLSSGGTGGTNILQITRSSDNPYMYQTQTVVVGKYYLIQARLQNGTASEVEVGMGSTNIGTQYGTFDHSSTSWTTHEKVIKATTTTLSIYVQVQTSSGSQYGYVDFVRVREVGTLVEFNPQSASSTKWRNEAILGFYDGTVNNATLSQGNTYWNNIKQDATDTTVSGELTVVPTASEKGVTIGDGTKGEVPLIFKGGSGSHSIGQNGGNFFISETGTGNLDSSARLSTDGQNVKIHNKLGVGTSADASHHLLVGGTARIEYAGGAASGLAIVGSSNRSKIAIVDNDTTAYVIAENDYISVGGNDSLNAANLNIHKSSGNVAIGATGAAQKLQVDGSIQLTNTAQTSSNFATNIQSIIFGDEIANTGARHQASINAVREAWSNSPCKLTFKTSAEVNSATTKLEIASDGTQDHKANRIVNSQTVSDSWRSSEPSLNFKEFDSTNHVVVSANAANNNPFVNGGTLSGWAMALSGGGASGSPYGRLWQSAATGCHLSTITSTGAKFYWWHLASTTQGAWYTTAETITFGKWFHWSVTYNSSDPTTAPKIYINGVSVAVTTSTTLAGTPNADTGAWTIGNSGAGANRPWHGEIKGFHIHNRAMEAEEIKGLYNGEATPWKYADAGAELSTASFTNSGFSATETEDLATSVTGFTGPASSANNKMYKNQTFSDEQEFKVKFTVSDGESSNLYFNFRTSANGEGSNTGSIVSSSKGTATSNAVTLTATGDYEVIVKSLGSAASYRFVAAADVGKVVVSNFSITQLGEVAAYTPQSIGTTGGKWSDTTSNNNHGTITGATNVNETVLGALQIKGATDKNRLQIFGTESTAERLELFHDGTNGYIQSTASTGSHYGLNFRARQYYFATWRDSAWTNSLELANDGSVKATSADSDNRKQVARVEANQVTWPNATASTVAFRIDHGLGVDAPLVQVYEDAAPYGLVDVEVRQGDWIGADFGAVGTEQGASESAKDANRIRYVTVVMAANPGNATKWNYRVTG